jgi:hypothetical protein
VGLGWVHHGEEAEGEVHCHLSFVKEITATAGAPAAAMTKKRTKSPVAPRSHSGTTAAAMIEKVQEISAVEETDASGEPTPVVPVTQCRYELSGGSSPPIQGTPMMIMSMAGFIFSLQKNQQVWKRHLGKHHGESPWIRTWTRSVPTTLRSATCWSLTHWPQIGFPN